MINAARTARRRQDIWPFKVTPPKHLDEIESPRRGTVRREAQESALSRGNERADEPGEDVLGGADGVPLSNDTPPKRPDPFES